MRVLVLCLFLLSMSCLAAIKPVVRVVIPADQSKAISKKAETYQRIIEAALENHYQLDFISVPVTQLAQFEAESAAHRADIIVPLFEQEPQDNKLYSAHHIDKHYPVQLLYDASHVNFGVDEPAKKHLFAVTSDIAELGILPPSAGVYHADNLSQLPNLLRSRRVDGIVTYSYNVHLADPSREFQTLELVPASKVLLKFNNNIEGQRLATEFDAAMTNLIQSNQLAQYFPNNADYVHADFTHSVTLSPPVNWHVMAKKYSEDGTRLEPLPHELAFSKNLLAHMPSVNFNIEINSSRVALDTLKGDQTSCILNISKTPDRELIAHFSSPTYAFLSPRLLVLDSSPLIKKMGDYTENVASLTDLFNTHPNTRVAIVENGNTEKTLTKELNTSTLNKLYKIKDVTLTKLMTMLLSQRVDAVIAWPSHVPNIINDEDIARHITSFAISELKQRHFYSYIACSRNAEGQQIIETINKTLASPEKSEALFAPILQTMDRGSAEGFRKLILTN
ncbi:hypothetical protein ACFSJY_03420 [Thalassotalea euphylliae]|uniref:hypothetical protein n=1 Tax=Thalassotalea euphylliae TaxID=1655234 RepID=UPI00362D632B